MERSRYLTRVVEAAAIAAGWGLFALALLVGFEVIARKFFAYSLKGVDEVGGYVLAIASAIGFIYGLAANAHIRVDILITRLGVRTQVVLHFLAYLTLAVFALLFAWRAAAVLWRSWILDAVAPTPLATPLTLPQGLWVLALACFAVTAITVVVQLALIAWRNGARVAAKRFSPISAQEEARLEVEDYERRTATSSPQSGP